jgi:hypothetical protein
MLMVAAAFDKFLWQIDFVCNLHAFTSGVGTESAHIVFTQQAQWKAYVLAWPEHTPTLAHFAKWKS